MFSACRSHASDVRASPAPRTTGLQRAIRSSAVSSGTTLASVCPPCDGAGCVAPSQSIGMAIIEQERRRQPFDRFELFQQVCDAAGLKPGIERIGVLLRLPEDVQHTIWSELADRVGQDSETVT